MDKTACERRSVDGTWHLDRPVRGEARSDAHATAYMRERHVGRVWWELRRQRQPVMEEPKAGVSIQHRLHEPSRACAAKPCATRMADRPALPHLCMPSVSAQPIKANAQPMRSLQIRA